MLDERAARRAGRRDAVEAACADGASRRSTRGLHVFCEKPFVLDVADGERLVALAEAKALVTQVGYHYRFVGAFKEAARLVEVGRARRRSTTSAPRPTARSSCAARAAPGARPRAKAAARSTTTPATRSTSSTSSSARPTAVGGVVRAQRLLARRRRRGLLHAALRRRRERPALRQLERRELSQDVDQDLVWGTNGRITADRQECQLYLREPHDALPGVGKGWTVRYTTDLSDEVWFYLRGEEYSAQIDYFAESVPSQSARRREHVPPRRSRPTAWSR